MEFDSRPAPGMGVVTAAAFLVAALTMMVAGGDALAAGYSSGRAQAAASGLQTALAAFDTQYAASVAEGTPPNLLSSIRARVAAAERVAASQGRHFADSERLRLLADQAATVSAAAAEIRGVEAQAEVELHQQLEQALGQLSDDIPAARGLGVDTASAEAYSTSTEAAATSLLTPATTRAMVEAVAAKDRDLQGQTTARVAELAAAEAAQAAALLQQARGNAAAMLARAQAAVGAVRAIGGFDVGSQAAVIDRAVIDLAGAQTIEQFQAIAAELDGPAGSLEAISGVRQSALDLLAAARATAAQAAQAKIDVTASNSQLDAAQQAIGNSTTLDALYRARAQVQVVKNDLDFKVNQALFAAAAGHVIFVSLARQELRAVQDGVVLYTSLVGTGKPVLPTPTGTFQITAKYSPYRMVSPWPPGDPFYYPPTWLKYAMLWHDGGYFIHDASWRTVWGPGANSSSYGSHGCINVPLSAAAWLYNWAPVGTTVTVLNDF